MSTIANVTDMIPIFNRSRSWPVIMILVLVLIWTTIAPAAAMPNACSVDGCEVKIVGVQKSGDELEITFESNFTPDNSKNHFHVWWGENFTVEQVSRNAQTVHGVKQGRWHRHADYPTYITQGAASTSVRDQAGTICVSAADRNHNILDVNVYNCVDVSDKL